MSNGIERRAQWITYSLLGAALMVTSFGCATPGFDLNTSTVVDIPIADIPPPLEPARQVVLLPFKPQSSPGARAADADDLAQSETAKLVMKAGAHIVDADLIKGLAQHIKQAENQGMAVLNTKLATDVIKGGITDVQFKVEHKPAHEEKNIFTGKMSTIPAKCHYTAEATGYLSFFSMNPISQTKRIDFSGVNLEVVDSADPQCPGQDDIRMGLIRKAAIAGMTPECGEIMKALGPVGYVQEYRNVTGKASGNYLRISIGKNEGAVPGNEASIIRQVIFHDRITGEKRLTKNEIMRGKIVTQLGTDDVWVKITDPARASQVQAGDLVTVNYKRGWTIPGLPGVSAGGLGDVLNCD